MLCRLVVFTQWKHSKVRKGLASMCFFPILWDYRYYCKYSDNPVPNCKHDGRKLNHSSSTLTNKERNNCMAMCLAITSVKWDRVVTERLWGNCQAWFNRSHMIIKRILGKKMENLISISKSNFSSVSREMHKLKERKVPFMYAKCLWDKDFLAGVAFNNIRMIPCILQLCMRGSSQPSQCLLTNNVEVDESWNHFSMVSLRNERETCSEAVLSLRSKIMTLHCNGPETITRCYPETWRHQKPINISQVREQHR